MTAAATSTTAALGHRFFSSLRAPCRPAQSRANCQATRPLREPRCSDHCSASSLRRLDRLSPHAEAASASGARSPGTRPGRRDRTTPTGRSARTARSSPPPSRRDGSRRRRTWSRGSPHVLRHQVAPVGGGVDQQVLGRGRDRAVERHLERDVARLGAVEREVVAEQDEALRPRRPRGRRCPAGRRGRCFSTSIRRRPLRRTCSAAP